MIFFVFGAFKVASAYFYLYFLDSSPSAKYRLFFEGLSMSLKGFVAYLWNLLWVFLWSLLLVVPGIIKSLSYSQMFFIMAENPNLSIRGAMKLSQKMTKGFKMNIFLMKLSFWGWHILGVFTFGILELWILPYQALSMANAYYSLKQHGFVSERISLSDFYEE